MNKSTQLKDMLKAYYPIVYITTFEYARTIQQVRNTSLEINEQYIYYQWNYIDGLTQYSSQNNKHEKLDNLEEPEEVLRFIESRITIKDIQTQPEIFLLEDFHEYIEERGVKIRLRKLAEILRYCRKHIIIVSPVLKLPIELEKYITVLEWDLPNRDDLKIVLNKVLNDSKINIEPYLENKLVDSALGMTYMEADLAFCLAAVKTRFDSSSPFVVSQEKEQIIKKSGLLEYVQNNDDIQEIGGMSNLKDWLEKRKLAYDLKAQLWHLTEPKGLLLLGVPGCGKSLTAKCISSYWKMPLLRLDIGKVFQGIVGSSEENIRRAIMTAEAIAPCVLWIDEIEKGLSGVQSSSISDGGTTSRIFSTILTWMQEKTKPVFVVATANNISLLPPELLRKGRFDEIFFVDLPSEEERKSIFRIHLKKREQNPDIFAIDKLATETDGFNGAEIEECIKEAMFSAFVENQETPKLQIIHLLNAIHNTVPLSATMKEQITALRNWAATRAKNASKESNEVNREQPVVLTRQELEIERSFELNPKE